MASVRNLLRRLRFWKRTSEDFGLENSERDLTRTLKQYEYYVYKIQNILVWENPSESLFAVAAVNLLFWVFVNLEWRFYGIIFTGLLLTTLHEAWSQQVWPEIRIQNKIADREEKSSQNEREPAHQSVIMLSKVIDATCTVAKEYYAWLKNMREQNPGTFCCLMTGVFLALSVVGQIVPGLLLSYLVIMAGLICPGVWIHVVSEETKKSLHARWETLANTLRPSGETGNTDEDEYMLDESGENLAVLAQVVDPDSTNDSMLSQGSTAAPFSFTSGVLTMPAHDDISLDSMATFSELDLALDGGGTPRALRDIEEFSDDSSSNGGPEEAGEIEFRSGHFNGDDSSSSEEEEKLFAADLTFTETDSNLATASSGDSQSAQRTTIGALLTANLGNLGAVGQNILSTVIGRTSPRSEPAAANNDSLDSLTSDDDFEMITHDDVS